MKLPNELKNDLDAYLADKETVLLAIYWPDDWHYLELSAETWREISSGLKVREDGEDFWYEGEEFTCCWIFNTSCPGSLIITYSPADSDSPSEGVGYDGSITDAFAPEGHP